MNALLLASLLLTTPAPTPPPTTATATTTPTAKATPTARATPTTPTTPTTTTAPRVFSLDVEAQRCLARLRTPGTADVVTLFTTTICPTAIVLDTPRRRVLGVDGDKVVAWGTSDGARKVLAPAPAKGTVLSVTSTGAVRAAWLVTDGVTVTDTTTTTVRFEGRDHVITDAHRAAFPPWGTPAMAVLAELSGGAWKRLEVTPTKTEAGDTIGLGALSTSTASAPGVVVIADRAATMICAGGEIDCEQSTPALKARIAPEAENIGVVPHGTGFLVFGVLMGDTLHAMSPVYFCADAACANKAVVEPRGPQQRQLALATRGGFALIATEYSNDNARLLDAAGKTVLSLPSSSAVVFLP